MKWMLVAVTAMLAGCSVGIKENGGLHSSFAAPVSYQDAYRRADAYARHCRTSDSLWKPSFNVGGDLFTDTQKGIVRISTEGGRDLERIEIASSSDAESHVEITAWGSGIWDEREMRAARESILTGKPTCRKDV